MYTSDIEKNDVEKIVLGRVLLAMFSMHYYAKC